MSDSAPPTFPYAAAIVCSFGLTVAFSQLPDQTIARFALGLMLVLFGCWFVRAFVSKPLYVGKEADRRVDADALRDIYRFAYVFALVAFALLMLPFTSLSRDMGDPGAGPIRIMRGCVNPEFAASASATAAASAASAPVGGRAEANPPLPPCREDIDRYPVLVSVGGAAAKAVAVPVPASAASSGQGKPVNTFDYHKISGGLVVPVFVVALGFIGGAVSLTRKVPEYQRRTEPEFTGTTQDLPLKPYEAREFVVFQILQLVTAPMLAILAFLAFAPQTMAVAVAQAFFAGFASEWVLLRIRLIVDGPKLVATEAANKPTATLTVTVKDARAQPVPGATVELRRTQSGPVEANGTTNAAGQFVFRDIEAGPAFVRAIDAAGLQKSLLQSTSLKTGGNQVELVVP